MTRNDYASKIAKLLSKAESTTPEEAELLVEKAQELMTKYAIDEAMVAAQRGDEAPQKIVEATIDFEGTMAEPHAWIASHIAEANECRVLWTQGAYKEGQKPTMRTYNRRVRVIGFEGDVERVKMLNASLQIQAVGALGKWWKTHEIARTMSRGRKFRERRQFLESFGKGLGLQLGAARDRVVAAEAAARGTGVELVLRSKGDRVNDWIDEKYGKLVYSKVRRTGGTGLAHAAGQTAGMHADVGSGGRIRGGHRELGR